VQINSSPQRLLNSVPQRDTSAARPRQSESNDNPVAAAARSSSTNPEVLVARQADVQRNNELLERNPRNRNALQAYFDNSTSPPEPGAELAGIDTYI
jgi:hypothetical protein